MKKLLQLGLILACLGSALAGCAPKTSGPLPIQDKVTLEFIVPNEYEHLYDAELTQFKEKEPNITVTVRGQGFANQAGDVAVLRWAQINQGRFLENNPPLDLTPLLEQDSWFKAEDYFPGALDTFRSQGKLFALPTGLDPNVMFYNQDLFDKKGVVYPRADWTWDQFRQTAQQLTDVNAKVYGYRPSQRYMDSLYFVYQNGGSLYDDQSNPKLDGPETIRAVEWYTSLFGPNGPAASEEQMREAYGLGAGNVGIVTSRIAMWMGNVSSLTSDFSGMIHFKVGMAPIPRGERGVSLAQFEGLMIQSQTKNPQAAWRLVSFLAQQPNTWVYPARKSLAESQVFLSAFGKDQAAGVRAALENSTQVTGINFGRFSTAMMMFSTAVRRSIDEGMPAADSLKKSQEDFQK